MDNKEIKIQAIIQFSEKQDKESLPPYIGPYGDGVSYNEPQKPTPKLGHIGPYGDGIPFGE